MENKKYFYFRFVDSFFDEEVIFNMEQFPIYGDKLIVTLLKLYVYATKNHGYIRIEKTLPEDTYVMKLAKLCRVDSQFMATACAYYQKNNLMEVFDNEDVQSIICSFPYVANNTGKSSKDADRKRKEREFEHNEVLTLERDDVKLLDELSLSKDKNTIKFGEFKNVELTEQEYEQFCNIYENAEVIINRMSTYMYANNKVYDKEAHFKKLHWFANFNNLGILKRKETKEDKQIKKERYLACKNNAEKGIPVTTEDKHYLTENEISELNEIALNVIKKKGFES